MARFRFMMAALAAGGLTLAQPAMAAARIGSPVGDAEAQAQGPGAGMIAGLLGIVGLVFLIMAISDSEDPTADLPTSP